MRFFNALATVKLLREFITGI